jgi:hypothetical protein
MDDHDNERQLPSPIPDRSIPNEFRDGKTRQAKPPRMPSRAIAAKANELRAAIRNGGPPDWSDLYERFCDLWQEARQVIWRAKHSKAGLEQWEPEEGRDVLTFVAEERLVLQAIDTTRGVLDSLVRLRAKMPPTRTSIPRWAIERIERVLRNQPKALEALLAELTSEDPDFLASPAMEARTGS